MADGSFPPEACARALRESRCTVTLTGAGVSTAAGIPDFRGPQGLYVTRRYDPEAVFDITAFRRNPAPFYEFTRDFLAALDELEPTFTHVLLAQLETAGLLDTLITQNVDPLHQRAGSRHVVSIHGDYWTSHCMHCGRSFTLDEVQALLATSEVPHCSCGGVIKPDVVFFGEPVHQLESAAAAVSRSELLLVLGSSLTVYPAAFLPQYAGGTVVVVNRGPAAVSRSHRVRVVEEDLDTYFREVAAHLELEAPITASEDEPSAPEAL